MGYAGLQGEYIVALENTSAAQRGRLYPVFLYGWPVLGLPPDWYKARISGAGGSPA